MEGGCSIVEVWSLWLPSSEAPNLKGLQQISIKVVSPELKLPGD